MITTFDEPINVTTSRKELPGDDQGIDPYTAFTLHLDNECDIVEVAVHDRPGHDGLKLYFAASNGSISGDDLRAIRAFFNDPRIVALCESDDEL